MRGMPLLPLPMLRILEGLMAIICIAGVLASLFFWAVLMKTGPNELFGIWVTPTGAFAAILVFMLGTIWFAVNAIRGGSTKTDTSDKPPVSDPE